MRIAFTRDASKPPRVFLTLALFAFVAAVPATAQIVVYDHGPSTGTYGGYWANRTSGQNFADNATLPAATTITAINIYTNSSPLTGTAHVKILADNAGAPGSVLYSEDKAPDSWTLDVPSGRYEVRTVLTTPFAAQAGVTYWYGVSGDDDMVADMGQDTVQTPGDGVIAQFQGSTLQLMQNPIGDQMFQLEGQPVQAIRALGNWGLVAFALVLAVAAVAAIRRLA